MNFRFFAPVALLLLFAGIAGAANIDTNTITYEPAPVAPGGSVNVWVFVKNTAGNDAIDAMVKLEPEYPFSLLPGQSAELNIGRIAAYQTISVQYRLLVDQRAVDGTYDLRVSSGEGGLFKSTGIGIKVLSRTPKLEIVETDVAEASPGSTVQVNLTIKNVGGGIAKSIVVKTKEDRTVTTTGVVVARDIISIGAVSKYIESLGQSQDSTVQMALGINQDASLKNYSVPITMEYYDINGTARADTAYIGLKVTSKPDLDAVVGSVKPFAFPGTTAEVTVDLFNLGLADARYVVIELSGSNVAIEDPKQFIGTLQADDFDSFKTNIAFGANVQPGALPLNLKIVYKDEDFKEQTVNKTVTVKVLNAAEVQAATGAGGIAWIGIIGLALELVGLFVAARFAYRKLKQFRAKQGKSRA